MQRVRRLLSRRSARRTERRFVTEGPKLLEEALLAGAEVELVFLDAADATDDLRALAERAAAAGAAVRELAPGVLGRISDAVAPQPIAAVVAMVDRPLQSLPAEGLTVVCAGLQDPGNAGTVIRSASASGVGAVVFCEGAVDVYNPKAVRASAGTLFHVPLAVGPDAEEVLARYRTLGVTTIGTVVNGGVAHDDVDWTAPAALMLGSESQGLVEALEGRVDRLVTIPMAAGAESLNVAMAATVICFEAARQRRANLSPAPRSMHGAAL